ncbi:MAG: hypothetical protein HY751_12755 [Nitrospinae bacterium]|nr:hypothetical protein [Nitrospinota bacterium]
MEKITVYVLVLFALTLGACGAGSSSSSSSDSSTYSGTLDQTVYREGASRLERLAECALSSPITITINTDGTASGTTTSVDTYGAAETASCRYVGDEAWANWTGTFDNGAFTMSSSGSGPHVSFSGSSSGVYTDTTITGAGSGTVTVTTSTGAQETLTVEYTLSLTKV